MGIRTELALDDFNRAGPGLGGDWVTPLAHRNETSPFTIVSNQLQGSDVAGAATQYDGVALGEDVYASVELHNAVTSTSYWEAYIFLRSDDDVSNVTEYGFGINGDGGDPNTINGWIFKQDAGTYIGLKPPGAPWVVPTDIVSADIVDGTKLLAEVYGNRFKLFLGDTMLLQHMDTDPIVGTSPTNTVVVVLYVAGGVQDVVMDNFRVGNLGPVRHKQPVLQHGDTTIRHKDQTLRHNGKGLDHQS